MTIICFISGHRFMEGSTRLFGLVAPVIFCEQCGKYLHMNVTKETDIDDTSPEKNTDHKEENTSPEAESNT